MRRPPRSIAHEILIAFVIQHHRAGGSIRVRPILFAGGPRTGAGEFVFSMNCTYQSAPGVTDTPIPDWDVQASAGFRIPSRSQAGDNVEEIWVDISLFNNNFAADTFLALGRSRPATTSISSSGKPHPRPAPFLSPERVVAQWLDRARPRHV